MNVYTCSKSIEAWAGRIDPIHHSKLKPACIWVQPILSSSLVSSYLTKESWENTAKDRKDLHHSQCSLILIQVTGVEYLGFIVYLGVNPRDYTTFHQLKPILVSTATTYTPLFSPGQEYRLVDINPSVLRYVIVSLEWVIIESLIVKYVKYIHILECMCVFSLNWRSNYL